MSQNSGHDLNRRRALAQLSAASLAASLGTAAPWAWAQKPLTVGFIYVGPKDDFGYNQAHAESAALVKKMAGIKVVEEENVPETQAVQKTMQGMIAQDGASLLFPRYVPGRHGRKSGRKPYANPSGVAKSAHSAAF